MKRLSFILALIIALSGMIGLFATPAYAAITRVDLIVTENGDNDMSSTTYSTVGSALEAANALAQGTVYIRVDTDTAETFNNTPIAKNVVIYSDNATAPTLTATADVEVNTANSADGSNYGGVFDMAGGTLTLENLNIVTEDGEASAGNYCAVYFSNTAAGTGTLTIDRCSITTVGRGIHINAGTTFENGVTINISNSVINAGGNGIQHNARTNTEATAFRLNCDNVTISAGGNYAIQVQQRTAYININNCRTGTVKTFYYAGTVGSVHEVNITNCTLETSSRTIYHRPMGEGAIFNFVNTDMTTGSYVYHAQMNNTNQETSHTVNFINCNLECTGSNYIAAIDPNSKSGANITSVMNIYSGTYTTAGKGLLNNDADARINIYGGKFTSTSASSAFIMGANTKAYVYGGTIDASVPFAANNAGNQATGVTCTDGVYTPDTVATNVVAGAGQVLTGTTAASDKTSVRLVISLTADDLATFGSVGAYISVGDATALTGTTADTNKVYTSVNADGVVVDAATGTYYVLLEIKDITNAHFGTTVYVRPYTTDTNGAVSYGAVASFTVSGLIG